MGPLIAFSAGVVAAHLQPLPLVAAVVLGASSCLACMLARTWRIPGAFGVGVAWAALAIGLAPVSEQGRPPCEAGVSVLLAVEGLPVREGESLRFEGRLLEAASCGLARGDRVRLGWTAPDVPLLRPGQHWRVAARIDQPRAHANAFVFDYERWLARHRIAATGYVTGAFLEVDERDAVDDWRWGLREQVRELGLARGGAILALSTGDTALVSTEAWRLLRETATVHLLVISGLHVGMFAVLGMALGNGLARLLPITRRCRARAVGGVVALAAVIGYATVAGWTLPVTRAALMAGTGVLAATVGRRVRASGAFALALAVLLAFDPLVVLETGFWLSFGAVGVLIAYFAPRVPRRRVASSPAPWAALRPRATDLIVAQLVVAVAFAPMLGVFVGHVHPLAPVVNLVLIPVVAMVAAPLSVLGVLMLGIAPSVAGPILGAADGTLGVVMWIVNAAAALDGLAAATRVVAPYGAVVLALAFLFPWSRVARVALALGALAALTRQEAPAPGAFDVTVLDVGQGAATVVRTRHHVLLHDTGPRYPTGFDVGEAVVVPHVLRAHGGRVTELVLSHADIDHVGGTGAVMRLLDVRGVALGEPVPGVIGHRCRAGDAWLWDGVRFRVLWPASGPAGNDASCVVEVDDGTSRVVLAGDIERAAERRVRVARATLLAVPHHGSRTSSTASFVRRTCPRFAVVSAGFRNHFGHPHPEVVERYRSIGAHVLTTGDVGAIRWRSVAPGRVSVGRDDWRYWRADARPGFSERIGAVGSPGGSCAGR